jgi:DNA-binding NtrC family response regulator
VPDAIATAELSSVMVVDDEPQMIRICERLLSRERFSVTSFADAREALADLKTRPRPPDALLADLHMPGMSGLELLHAVRELWPTLPTVMMTGRATVAAAVEAMRLGAYDYVLKPFEPIDLVVAALRRAIEHKELLELNRSLQLRLAERDRFDEIVGSSTAMQEIRSAIASIAPNDAAVLLVGEGGTGKELCARAIHKASLRSGRAFVAVDCSATSPSMLEGELFGHARGAFTGALSARRGLFEEAAGGSVFLDHIGKLRPSTQALILRVLQ